jgi:DNA-binding NarL/FixJ family response regulator
MPDVDGFELISQLTGLERRPRVLVLSVAADARSIVGAFEAGADGFLGKHESFESVLHASRAVMRGENPISPAAFSRVLPRLIRSGGDLTEQEERVLGMLAEGLANDDIAEQLTISYNTVRNHVSSILRKLDVDNRGAAVAEARRRLLIPPE